MTFHRNRVKFLSPDDIEETFYKSSGPGGQRKNKRETAVRLRHLPSGITVVATEHRSQAKNRELAMMRLVEKLKALSHRPRPRIPTHIPRQAKTCIMEHKQLHSRKKSLRAQVRIEE